MKQDQLFDIKGHVAFVTGAASGLGLAFAEVMAENGARVVLADIDAAATRRRPRGSQLALGCAVEQAVVDIRDSDALRAAIDATTERHGRLDAVFANAGSPPVRASRSPDGTIDAMDMRVPARHRREPDRDVHDHPLRRRPYETATQRQHHRHRLDRRPCARTRWSATAMSRPRPPSAISCGTPRSTRAPQCAGQCDRAGPFLTNIAGGGSIASRGGEEIRAPVPLDGLRSPTRSRAWRCCWRRRREASSPAR